MGWGSLWGSCRVGVLNRVEVLNGGLYGVPIRVGVPMEWGFSMERGSLWGPYGVRVLMASLWGGGSQWGGGPQWGSLWGGGLYGVPVGWGS